MLLWPPRWPHWTTFVIRILSTSRNLISTHGRMNYKDTKRYVDFSFSWPVNRICGILFNRFYRMEIHSLMVCIFGPACELLLPWMKELYGTCVLLPLYCTFSLTSSPLPNVQFIQTVCDLWGVLKCTVDHIPQEFYTLFLTRFRTYKIASPPQTKMTSKDDIKGLVSLKFLRPCFNLFCLLLL